MNFTDTIAAIATPIGEGGIGIIRISGNQAKEYALKILLMSSGKPYINIDDHVMNYGKVYDPDTGQILDEVLFFYAKKPRSFTAEDVVEIHAHGGMLILSKILNLIIRQGARLAEPGEFTMRAFLNGRIDLIQAESIIDLIRAKTDKAHELALAQLSGEATQKIHLLENKLYDILITIEAALDYPEDGIPELHRQNAFKVIHEVKETIQHLIASINEGRKIREGIQIVIIGRPNVGKSSLLNAFLQEERAIVTEIPGTTRDIIEAQFQLQGVPIILIDTAGVRDTDNPIEQIGIEKASRLINTADLILWVIDGSQPLTHEDLQTFDKIKNQKVLAIINKTDLPLKLLSEDIRKLSISNVIEVSSLNRTGFKQLEQKIIDLVGLGEVKLDDRPLLSRIRHKNALEQASSLLDSFEYGLINHRSEDLLAVDLRSCLSAIGEITGKNVNEEVLQGIFSKFCIGK